MNKILSILPSMVLYGLGLASFFFLDIYISTNFDEAFVSQWAFYKSSVFILGGFCILGFDQVMVREPKLHFFIKGKFLLQSFLISIIGTTLVWIFYPIENILLFFIVLNVFSIVIFLSSIYRANQKYTIAQLATNGWKIVVVALFFILFQDKMLQLLVISLAFIAILLIGLYLKNFRNIPSEEKGNYNFKELRKTGLAFFLHNMTLTSAIYGEQFIINLYGNETISSELFMYFAVFSPIILSANGFIGFIIGPKLRAKKEIFRSEYNKLQIKLLGFAIVMSLISLGVGIVLLDSYKGIPMKEVNVALVTCVLICCIIRTIYTASSLYLGVFGSNKHLYKTAGLNWGALIGYITLVLLSLISNIAIEELILLIAVLTSLHWLSRLIISHSYAIKVFTNEKN